MNKTTVTVSCCRTSIFVRRQVLWLIMLFAFLGASPLYARANVCESAKEINSKIDQAKYDAHDWAREEKARRLVALNDAITKLNGWSEPKTQAYSDAKTELARLRGNLQTLNSELTTVNDDQAELARLQTGQTLKSAEDDLTEAKRKKAKLEQELTVIEQAIKNIKDQDIEVQRLAEESKRSLVALGRLIGGINAKKITDEDLCGIYKERIEQAIVELKEFRGAGQDIADHFNSLVSADSYLASLAYEYKRSFTSRGWGEAFWDFVAREKGLESTEKVLKKIEAVPENINAKCRYIVVRNKELMEEESSVTSEKETEKDNKKQEIISAAETVTRVESNLESAKGRDRDITALNTKLSSARTPGAITSDIATENNNLIVQEEALKQAGGKKQYEDTFHRAKQAHDNFDPNDPSLLSRKTKELEGNAKKEFATLLSSLTNPVAGIDASLASLNEDYKPPIRKIWAEAKAIKLTIEPLYQRLKKIRPIIDTPKMTEKLNREFIGKLKKYREEKNKALRLKNRIERIRKNIGGQFKKGLQDYKKYKAEFESYKCVARYVSNNDTQKIQQKLKKLKDILKNGRKYFKRAHEISSRWGRAKRTRKSR